MPEPEVIESTTEVDPANLDTEALEALLSGPDKGTPAEETPAPPETPPAEPEPPALEAKPATPQVDPAQEIERLKKQLADKDAFIGRQTTEIGNLRQKANALRDEAREGFAEDPVAATEKIAEARALDSQIADRERTAQEYATRDFVSERVPGFDGMIDDIAGLVDEDMARGGFTEDQRKEVIAKFKAKPYAEQPEILYNLALRAQEKRKASTLETQLKELAAKVDTLSKKPGEVAAKIEAAARSAPTLTAAASGASTSSSAPHAGVTESDLANLSDAELEALLKS